MGIGSFFKNLNNHLAGIKDNTGRTAGAVEEIRDELAGVGSALEGTLSGDEAAAASTALQASLAEDRATVPSALTAGGWDLQANNKDGGGFQVRLASQPTYISPQEAAQYSTFGDLVKATAAKLGVSVESLNTFSLNGAPISLTDSLTVDKIPQPGQEPARVIGTKPSGRYGA